MGNLLPVGKVNKLFGRKGEVAITLYNTFPDNFSKEEPLLVEIDSLTVPLFFSSFERRGVSGAIVAFDDLDTPERATELIGRELSIEIEAEEADDDEFYMEDLIGFVAEVVDEQGTRVAEGRVTDYYDSEANPLLGLELGGREVLVPAVEEFIVQIDFEGERIVFLLPEGLMEL
ncbi:MAG: 16S rRNA processing protein RimM [Rikenellaceae bacterium]|jgi:16S rRNA processing protein RimM|nr:16S rRNA processing protein RimM [Rikenellaceae bacterium]MBQ5853205.1 16S rRNA processing protein RimM [Rikenellaceae bacterium]